jgi:hypothetical protein
MRDAHARAAIAAADRYSLSRVAPLFEAALTRAMQ